MKQLLNRFPAPAVPFPLSKAQPLKQACALLFICVAIIVLFHTQALCGDLYIVQGTIHSNIDAPFQGTLVIRDGEILRLEREGTEISPGPEDTLFDATGMIVTPGFIEFNTQLGLVEIDLVDETRDANAGGDEVRAGFQIAEALNPASTLIPIARQGGITSAVSHPNGGLISGQSAWWDLAGESWVEIMVTPSATMDLSFGAGAASITGGSRGGAVMRYREIFYDVADFISNQDAYHSGLLRDLSMSLLDIEAMIPVLSGDLPVLAHVQRRADIEALLRLRADYGFDLILSGASEAWLMAEELAELNIPVVLNPLENLPNNFEQLASREDNAAILERAGVPVIITTGWAHNARLLRQYAGNAVRSGMSHQGALRAVTLNPAEAVGLSEQYGCLQQGAVANVVIWSGDPFEISTQIEAIYIRGESISLSSRQSVLFDRYRTLEQGRTRLEEPEIP